MSALGGCLFGGVSAQVCVCLSVCMCVCVQRVVHPGVVCPRGKRGVCPRGTPPWPIACFDTPSMNSMTTSFSALNIHRKTFQ